MLHKDIGIGFNHRIQQWEPADEAARLALSVTVDDIGKIARQLDTGDFYILIDNSPLDWRVFASPDAVAGVLEVTARNNTGVSIAKARAVYITGASGQTPTIALANAVSEATSSKTIGITKNSIANSANEQIVLRGLLTNVDTSAFVDGDALWLSDSVAGAFTTTRPTQPSHGVFIGYVAYAHASQGKIIVNIQNGYELDELHNVLITSPLDGGILVYDTATQLWVDSTLLAELDPQIADIAPLSYTGNALKVMRVKATEDGWELVTPSTGGAIQVLDEGTPLTSAATSLNFVGAGVSAAVAGTDVTITIAGGGGGSSSGFVFSGKQETTPQTITTADVIVIEFAAIDTSGTFNVTTSEVTVPVSGYYRMNMFANISTANEHVYFYTEFDYLSSRYSTIAAPGSVGTTTPQYYHGTGIGYLPAGAVLQFFASTQDTGAFTLSYITCDLELVYETTIAFP
jgi:hypothetical protein